MAGQKDVFNAESAIAEVVDANEGINFDKKVQESIRRSTDVQGAVKSVVWTLLKEKIVWLILGASAFVLLELVKTIGQKLVEKI